MQQKQVFRITLVSSLSYEYNFPFRNFLSICNWNALIIKIEIEDWWKTTFPTALHILEEIDYVIIFVNAHNYLFTFPKTCFSVSWIIFRNDVIYIYMYQSSLTFVHFFFGFLFLHFFFYISFLLTMPISPSKHYLLINSVA